MKKVKLYKVGEGYSFDPQDGDSGAVYEVPEGISVGGDDNNQLHFCNIDDKEPYELVKKDDEPMLYLGEDGRGTKHYLKLEPADDEE